MADQQARVEITANASQAKAEIDSFAGKVRAAADGVRASFSGVSTGVSGMQAQVKGHLGMVENAIGTMQTRFLGFAALLAGGAAMKDSVADTVNFTKEAMGLSKALGINTTEAAALNVALGDVYSDADAMTGAADKLAKQLRTNESALNGLGVKTRDANGNFRNMRDLLLDTFAAVNQYREGTDRTLALQTAFGKGAEDMSKLLKLNAAAVEEAKRKQAELGLVVGVENVKAAADYRAAMNDVGDVLLALKKAVGDAVLPVLTQMAQWFNGAGPFAVTVMRGAINGLVTTFWALANGVNIVWEVLDSFVYSIAEPLLSLGQALYRVVQGDFKSAAELMMSWPDRVGKRWSAAWDSINESSANARDKMAQLWAEPTPAKNKVSNDKTFSGGGQDRNRINEWAGIFDQQKQAYAESMKLQGRFVEWGHAEESRYWQGILSRADLSQAEKLAAASRYRSAEANLRKQAAAADLAAQQVAIDDARGNYAQQAELMQVYVARVGDLYGLDSTQYQQALRAQLQMRRDHEGRLRDIANQRRNAEMQDRLADVADDERAAELRQSLGLISQMQLLEVRARTIEQRRQIELQAKQAELEAETGGPNDPQAVERIQAEIAAIKRRYKGLADENQGRQKVEKADPMAGFLGASQQTLQQGLDSIVARWRITANGIRDTARQLGQSLISEMVTKPFSQWVIQQARMVAMTWLFGQQKVAAEATAQGEITAVQAAGSLKTIGMRAYEAAAGAYSAIVSIPYVGPVLAPIAAGVALGGVMAFAKNIFSAEDGFDIPKGLNPLVQAHSNEMMLPSKHADTMRALSDLHLQGGLANGGGGTVNIRALDARSFEQMLRGRQGDMIVRTLARHVRNRTAG